MGESLQATAPLVDIRQEVRRILNAATAAGLTLRALGGVAVWLRCPSAQHPVLARTYRDADFAGLASQRKALEGCLVALGYEPDRTFNTLHGHQRLYFWDPVHHRQIDIFLDTLRMCHTLDFRHRLALDRDTLPLADLVLTKLQVWEANEKDVRDVVALFADHALTPDERGLNQERLLEVLTSDWGWYRTAKENVSRVQALMAQHGWDCFFPQASERLAVFWQLVEAAPKSRAWKMRAMIGERKRWYELPEDVRQDADVQQGKGERGS